MAGFYINANDAPQPCYVAGPDAAAAGAVARRWKLPVATPGTPPGLRLWVSDTDIVLGDSRSGAPGPIRVDFLEPAVQRRLRQAGAAREPLARAMGARRGVRPTVLDATAGLGRDAAVLAALGCAVTLVEISPVMGALLEDGLRRAAADRRTSDMSSRLTLISADGVPYLRGLTGEQRPEVVYLDPMYPQRSSGAKSGRAMQHLQALLGPAPEATGLLEAGLAAALRRVVVKRPRRAAPLAGPGRDLCFRGNSTRFDVYLTGP